eukprot:s78_g35.t1
MEAGWSMVACQSGRGIVAWIQMDEVEGLQQGVSRSFFLALCGITCPAFACVLQGALLSFRASYTCFRSCESGILLISAGTAT